MHEPVPDIAGVQPEIEGLEELRANELTCIPSAASHGIWSTYFLDRAGFAPADPLESALRKDAGIDPAVLAWLLKSFPVSPLPEMLLPLGEAELKDFRDVLAARFKTG